MSKRHQYSGSRHRRSRMAGALAVIVVIAGMAVIGAILGLALGLRLI